MTSTRTASALGALALVAVALSGCSGAPRTGAPASSTAPPAGNEASTAPATAEKLVAAGRTDAWYGPGYVDGFGEPIPLGAPVCGVWDDAIVTSAYREEATGVDRIILIDIASGTEKRSIDGVACSSGSVDDGRVLGVRATSPTDMTLVEVDLASGDTRDIQPFSHVDASVLGDVDGDRIVLGHDTTFAVRAVAPDGSTAWEHDLGQSTEWNCLLLLDDVVGCERLDSEVRFIDAHDGSVLHTAGDDSAEYEFTLMADGYATGTVLIEDGGAHAYTVTGEPYPRALTLDRVPITGPRDRHGVAYSIDALLVDVDPDAIPVAMAADGTPVVLASTNETERARFAATGKSIGESVVVLPEATAADGSSVLVNDMGEGRFALIVVATGEHIPLPATAEAVRSVDAVDGLIVGRHRGGYVAFPPAA